MQKSQEKGAMPDYKGNVNVAAWYNTEKNGNTYLSVVLGNRTNLFLVDKDNKVEAVGDILD